MAVQDQQIPGLASPRLRRCNHPHFAWVASQHPLALLVIAQPLLVRQTPIYASDSTSPAPSFLTILFLFVSSP